MIDPKYQQLFDTLDTIKNLCETTQLLITTESFHLIATQLEVLHIESQTLIDDFCLDEGQGCR